MAQDEKEKKRLDLCLVGLCKRQASKKDMLRCKMHARKTSQGSSFYSIVIVFIVIKDLSPSITCLDHLWSYAPLALQLDLVRSSQFILAACKTRASMLLKQSMFRAELAGAEAAVQVAKSRSSALCLLTPLLQGPAGQSMCGVYRVIVLQQVEILPRLQQTTV